MATPFFGKRENEPTHNARPGATGTYAGAGNSSPSHPLSSPSASSAQNTARPVPVTEPVAANRTTAESGSKLTVGPNIKLKGVEITDCDTLVVEGLVEATMDSRVVQIAEQGAFNGSAEIDVAEIRGEFNGNLTVRQKLVIYATGKVTGTIRYGKLVIEEGGQLSGEIHSGSVATRPTAMLSKPGLQVA